MDTFTGLTEKTALEYIERSPFRTSHYQPSDTLECRDLADGNVNLVFRVQAKNAPLERSLIVKQALPFARRYPEFKMPLHRAAIENGVLQIHNTYCPALVPKTFHYDQERYINIMEDLNRHIILRDGMMKQVVYQSFGHDIGTFLATSLFYTSEFFLDSDKKKMLVEKFVNPVLCKVTEDLVFTFPYETHPTNRFPAQLAPKVAAFLNTPGLQSRIRALKYSFMTNAQSLLHGDLHTGSIMVTSDETKVIDPEFAFVGPMGFDIGNVIANLIISWATQEFHAKDSLSRRCYQDWISETIRTTWNTFETHFVSLWNSTGLMEWRYAEFQSDFMRSLFEDSIGFAACEISRRTIGMAHVADLDEIDDEQAVCAVSEKLLAIAASFFTHRKMTSINECITTYESV